MSAVKVEMSDPSKPYQLALSARSHTITSDAPLSVPGAKTGGGDTAMNPHELFLGGLLGCIAMTTWMYALNKKWPLEKISLSVEEGKIDDPDDKGKETPSQIPHLPIKIKLVGNLTDEQKKRLETVAASCPVYKLLTGKKVVAKEFVFENGTEQPTEAEAKTT